MKKFLMICTLPFILLFLLITNQFYYLMDDEKMLKIPFSISNQQIYQNVQGELEPFDMIGMNLTSALPGSFPNEEELEESLYLEWLTLIQQLGVTVLRLPDLMPLTFYEALLTFNETQSTPLYLLQGIAFDEIALADGMDLQALREPYVTKIKGMIDCLYGGAYPESEELPLSNQSVDVSPYLLGYSLGMEWGSHDLIFSEIMGELTPYEGIYFYTTNEASSVESFLAELMDELIRYEFDHYGTQHLITMVGSNIEETLNYLMKHKKEGMRGEQTIKKIVDLNQIKTTDALESGYFASYHLYPVFGEGMKDSVASMLVALENTHEIPVVISEYGLPSAKVIYKETTEELVGINEEEQANALVMIYETLKQSNVMGSFVSDWQDRWDRTAWTTVEEIILDRSPYWKNELTYLQSGGLYTFDSSTSYPDNRTDDWKDENVLIENEQVQLSVKSDEAGLFFLIQWNETPPADVSYWIDLDVTPNSGSISYEKEGLSFDRPVDFIVNIDANNQSRVLVQRYYHTYEFLQNRQSLQIRPDQIEVSSDMDEFEPILMEVKSRKYDENQECFIDPVVQEAGRLLEGNANPSAPDFNSLANYYRGEGYVEIKIPWGILNFADPSTCQIHHDYYENFGISSFQISAIGIGLTIKSQDSEMMHLSSKNYSLTSWTSPTYEPRLKLAYNLLQEAFLSD